jgi:hypothetical protein
MLQQSFDPISFPEIREFLIDPNGNPLDGIKEIENEIESGAQEIRVKDDPLHNWISDAIFMDI